MKENKWSKNYLKWQLSSIEELKQLGYDGIIFDTDNSDNSNIEICEDGCIHFSGNFYISDKLVTAWEDSEYYLFTNN